MAAREDAGQARAAQWLNRGCEDKRQKRIFKTNWFLESPMSNLIFSINVLFFLFMFCCWSVGCCCSLAWAVVVVARFFVICYIRFDLCVCVALFCPQRIWLQFFVDALRLSRSSCTVHRRNHISYVIIHISSLIISTFFSVGYISLGDAVLKMYGPICIWVDGRSAGRIGCFSSPHQFAQCDIMAC